MAISSGSIQQLGQALGQVTDVMVSKQQAEARRQQQQQATELSNNIVQEAVSYRNKLIKSDVPSYLVDKQVKERIAKKEASYGLPIGTALSTYKKHFEGYKKVSENTKTITRDSGVEIVNLDTGEAKFIPSSKERILYENTIDEIKAQANDIITAARNAGLVLTSEEIRMAQTQEGQLQLMKDNPRFKRAFDNTAKAYRLQQLADSNKLEGETEEQALSNAMDEHGYSASITNTFKSVLKDMKNKPGNYPTPELAEQAFRSLLNPMIEESPKVFKEKYGDYVDLLSNQIKAQHRNSIKKGTADYAGYEAKELEAKNDAIIAWNKNSILNDDKTRTRMLAMIDMVKGVDFQSVYRIASSSGISPDTLMQDVFMSPALENKDKGTELVQQYISDASREIDKLASSIEDLSKDTDTLNSVLGTIKDYVKIDSLSPKEKSKTVFKIQGMANNIDNTRAVLDSYAEQADLSDREKEMLNSFIYKLETIKGSD